MRAAEDLQRRDLAPLEVAAAYAQLMKGFNYRLADLARVTGKNERQVAEVLLLLDSPKAPQPRHDTARATGTAEAAAAGSANPSLRTQMAALERHLTWPLGSRSRYRPRAAAAPCRCRFPMSSSSRA